MIVARECASLWFAAAPSLTELPTIPDIRISDALLACAGEERSRPRTTLAAAAVDLTAGTFGLLAAGVSETTNKADGRNWAEVASVSAHDLLACRSMKLAAAAGPEILEAYLLWADSVLHLRRRGLTDSSPHSVLRLYESVFELPIRLAAILRELDEKETYRLIRVSHLLGAACAFADEVQIQRGRKSRLGLDLAQTESNHLRCTLDQISSRWTLDIEAVSANVLSSLWAENLEQLKGSLGPEGHEMLDGLFQVGISSSPDAASDKPQVAL